MKSKNLDIDIELIKKAQEIAKYCLEEIPSYLKSGMTRQEIHMICEELMLSRGSTGWWTHNDPALILYGPYLTYSAHEDPSELFNGLLVADNDVVTIDVAPMKGSGWGDMTRTYVIENGKYLPWEQSSNSELIDGMLLENELHEMLIKNVNKDTTFADIHNMTTSVLEKKGYYNCDYHGNFGHSIEIHPDNRVTIIPEIKIKISEYGKPITYEPHICKKGGSIGVKHENMYLMKDGHLEII